MANLADILKSLGQAQEALPAPGDEGDLARDFRRDPPLQLNHGRVIVGYAGWQRHEPHADRFGPGGVVGGARQVGRVNAERRAQRALAISGELDVVPSNSVVQPAPDWASASAKINRVFTRSLSEL